MWLSFKHKYGQILTVSISGHYQEELFKFNFKLFSQTFHIQISIYPINFLMLQFDYSVNTNKAYENPDVLFYKNNCILGVH